MTPIPTHPQLRWPLDIRVDNHEGQKILIFNCPLGIADEPLVLIGAVGPIISALDGTRSIEDLVSQFSEYGVKQNLIEELVALLDKNLFLASPAFIAAENEIKERFKNSSTRPAALAGRGYALTKELLKTEIDQYLSHGVSLSKNGVPLAGIVSPHIDYRRGGACYGKTYTHLKNASHDLYVLIGTSHMFSKKLFHLTRKDFVNPLGVLPCDTNFIDSLAKQYGEKRSFEDEFLHKKEHSLELQIPFMSQVVNAPKIAPILVGGFHHMLRGDKLPNDFEEYETFAAALALGLKEYIQAGKRICIVAGVDMAHVGRHFGDEFELSPEYMKDIEGRDNVYLSSILTQNKDLMFRHVAEDQDARRICGFPTMYTVLDVFDRIGMRYKADLFDYSQAVDYSTQCAVTFAGIGMYG